MLDLYDFQPEAIELISGTLPKHPSVIKITIGCYSDELQTIESAALNPEYASVPPDEKEIE